MIFLFVSNYSDGYMFYIGSYVVAPEAHCGFACNSQVTGCPTNRIVAMFVQ